MSTEEILDWMAFERSNTEDFKKLQLEKARKAETAAEEANSIKELFFTIGK